MVWYGMVWYACKVLKLNVQYLTKLRKSLIKKRRHNVNYGSGLNNSKVTKCRLSWPTKYDVSQCQLRNTTKHSFITKYILNQARLAQSNVYIMLFYFYVNIIYNYVN